MRLLCSLAAFLAASAASAQSSQPSEPASAPVEQPASEPAAPAPVVPVVINLPPGALVGPAIVPPPVAEPLSLPPAQTRTPVFLPSRAGVTPEVHALLQAWFDSSAAQGGAFVARRAEIFAVGNVVPRRVSYAVSIDPARLLVENSDPADALGDLWLTGKLPNDLALSVGQFKLPIASEGFFLASNLLLPELSPVSLQFGDERALGAKLERWSRRFSYSIGVYNPELSVPNEAGASKDIAGRVEVSPAPGLVLAGAGLARIGTVAAADQKNRVELDASLRHNLWALCGELHVARDGDVPAGGAFVSAAAPLPRWEGAQLALRASLLGRDLRPEENQDALRELTLGVNYFLRKDASRFHASVSVFRGPNDADDKTQLLLGALFVL